VQFVFISFIGAYVVRMGRYRTYIVSFALSAEDFKRLDELSRSFGISRSRLVRDIVHRYLDEVYAKKQLPSTNNGVNNNKQQRRKLVLTNVRKVIVCESCGYILAEVPLNVSELHDTLICPRCRSIHLSLAIIPAQDKKPTNEQSTTC